MKITTSSEIVKMPKATAPIDLLRELRQHLDREQNEARSQIHRSGVAAETYAEKKVLVTKIDATLRDWA